MNPIRKIVQKFGLDLHRYRPGPDKFAYLKTLNLQTVLDIGANVGQFAKEIRSKLPQAQIYSFEPVKECFNKLNKNMEGSEKFRSFNFALGDKNQKSEINKSSYTPSSSILEMSEIHKTLFPHTKDSAPEEIEIKRLDEAARDLKLEKEILIKVDVQGFEDKVIAGGTEIFKKARVVLIENSFTELYLGQPLFGDIHDLLKGLGYDYHGSLQEKLDKKTGQILSEDSLFIRH